MKSECVEPPHVVAEKAEKKRRMEEDAEAASLAKKSRLNLPPLDIRPLNTSELDLVTYLVQAQADLEHPSVEMLDQIDSLVAATEEAEESLHPLLLSALSSADLMSPSPPFIWSRDNDDILRASVKFTPGQMRGLHEIIRSCTPPSGIPPTCPPSLQTTPPAWTRFRRRR